MSSRYIIAGRSLQDLDAGALDVITGNTSGLTDGDTYRLQNTRRRLPTRIDPVGAHHYACLIQTASEPTTGAQLARALVGAIQIWPDQPAVEYTPRTGLVGYIWSPYGQVCISINE